MKTGVWSVERREGGRTSLHADQYLQVLDWPATAACLCTQTRWYMVTYVQDGSETPTHALLTLYLSLFTTLLLLTFHYFNSRCILNDAPSIFLPSFFSPTFQPNPTQQGSLCPSALSPCLSESSKLKPTETLRFKPMFRQAYLRENPAKSSGIETLNASRYSLMCAHTCTPNEECLPTIGLQLLLPRWFKQWKAIIWELY